MRQIISGTAVPFLGTGEKTPRTHAFLRVPASLSNPRRLASQSLWPDSPGRFHSDGTSYDIIQFTAPIYYAEEGEGHMRLDLMRIGHMKAPCRVSYRTRDGSAVSGVKYVGSSGVVDFAAGECMKTIEIEIVDDDYWSPTTEFMVELYDAQSCELGNYLHHCRVKIIDNDAFPSNEYRELLKHSESSANHMSHEKLLVDSMKFAVCHVPGLGWRSAVILVFDQVHNVYLWYKLWASIYIVDTLCGQFENGVPVTGQLLLETREETACLIGILYVLIYFLVHMWAWWKVQLDISGQLCRFLQVGLFAKYLNYTEEARAKISGAKLQVSLTEEAVCAAENYVQTVDLGRTLGKFILLVYFMLSKNPHAWWCVILIPAVMTIIGVCSRGALIEADALYAHMETELVHLTDEVNQNFQLISAYAQRPRMSSMFETLSEDVKMARKLQSQISRRLRAWAEWISPVFTAVYLIFVAPKVFANELNLGVFLTTISVVNEISSNFVVLYQYLTEFSIAADAMLELTELFNAPTNLLQLKSLNRKRRKITAEAAHQAMHKAQDPDVFDHLPIKLENVGFTYSGFLDKPILQNCGFTVDQGSLVAIVGPHSSGKATLMRIIGNAFYASEGDVFVPMHLRILYVPQEPFLLSLPAFENLTFGSFNGRDKSPQRVLNVLKQLGFENEDFLQLIKQETGMSQTEDNRPSSSESSGEEDVVCNVHKCGGEEANVESSNGWHEHNLTSWQKTLSYTEKAAVNLARALIYNPEVLVLQRPLSHYSSDQAKAILSVLKKHVQERGLFLPSDTRNRRRPRTCFYIPEDKKEADYADMILQVRPGKDRNEAATIYPVSAKDLNDNFEPL